MSEIVNAYILNILALPHIEESQPEKIHEFYEKLLNNAQALETIGKLKEITGYVWPTVDKFEEIRGGLVRTDRDWQFPQLIEALRNPVKADEKMSGKSPSSPKRTRSYQTKQHDSKIKQCIYCEKTDHKSTDCNSVVTVTERKKILSAKQLCFNCTGLKQSS